MVARTKSLSGSVGWRRWIIAAILVVVGLWFFPLFHVVPLSTTPTQVVSANDPVAFAEKFWRDQLPRARADDAAIIAGLLGKNPKETIAAHARQVGLGGTAYFFVHGEGRVTAREPNAIRLALGDETDAPVVELQIGLIFGNVVRDGTGLLDVNQFSSLQDFNSLSAELNKRVESKVLPLLRDHAQVGARVSFTGCAEAKEPSPGRPVLSIIPVQAEVR